MHNKEEIRQKRKEAYQKAKAKRDADPRYQLMKEKVKEERKARYRAFKNQQKKEKLDAKQKRIAEKDERLMALMIPARLPEKGDNREPAAIRKDSIVNPVVEI